MQKLAFRHVYLSFIIPNQPLFSYGNNSRLGNKYAGYKHICRIKSAKNVKGRQIDKSYQIAHPIYLPPLSNISASPDSVKTVGGSEDVILKIPGLAGFQMKVKANSVTFPDGSRVGTLIVSPVTADKLPMSPPGGAAIFSTPAWTIQPAGTRFDPPIEVTLPNENAYPAGDNVPIVQWDHDLSQFVAMGRATVSEDGAVLICDTGSGITKAGWGGSPPPPPPKCQPSPPPDCSKYLCRTLKTSADGCTSDCEKDTSKKGNKGVEIATGVGPYQIGRKFDIPIPIFKLPKADFAGTLQGQMESQKVCCLGSLPGQEEGRRITLKATVEYGVEATLAFARFPIIFSGKGAVAGSVALEKDACSIKPPVVGEIEALGELKIIIGAVDEEDFKLNLISGSGTVKGKSKWTAESNDIVGMGTVEVDGVVNLLQFKFLTMAATGVTIKVPHYESPEYEIARFSIPFQ